MEKTFEDMLDWFIKYKSEIIKEFGFDNLTLVEPNDGPIHFEVIKNNVRYKVEDVKDLKFLSMKLNNRKLRPNDPCLCGSGRKFKKCCLSKEM